MQNLNFFQFSTRLCAWTLSIVVASVAAMSHAGGALGINQVWVRLADVNGERGSVESAEISPNNQYVVSGTKYDNTVRVFRVSDGFELWMLTLPQEIERVAWTADSKYVVSVSEDYMMRVIDAKSGEIVREVKHESGIDGLVLSNDGELMVSGRESTGKGEGRANVYATQDWSLLRSVNHGATINEIDFTSDDKFFVTSGHDFIRVWQTSNGKLLDTFDLNKYRDGMYRKLGFINVNIRSDDKYLAAGTRGGYVYIFTLSDKGKLKVLRRFNKTGAKIETLAWTQDGNYLATAGHSYFIDFYDSKYLLDKEIDSNRIPFAFRVPVSDALEYMAFNREGTLLSTAHQDGTVQLWTYMSGDPMINTRLHKAVKKTQSDANHK